MIPGFICCLLGTVGCGSSGSGGSPGAPASGPGAPGAAAVEPTFASLNSRLFQPRCASCHNDQRAAGGISLSSYESLIRSNSSHGHPIVVAGHAAESHLYESVESHEMPPSGPGATESEIAALRDWIDSGMPAG